MAPQGGSSTGRGTLSSSAVTKIPESSGPVHIASESESLTGIFPNPSTATTVFNASPPPGPATVTHSECSPSPTRSWVVTAWPAATVVGSSPTPNPNQANSSQGSPDSGLSTGAVAGLSLGLGLLVGLIAALILVLYRRRKARSRKNHNAHIVNVRGSVDGEALLYQEKVIPRESSPLPRRPTYTRITEWVQRTRVTSLSSKAPSSILSKSESQGEGTTAVGAGVIRSQSNASSRSAYSQASAFHSTEQVASRPPDLYRINE
ncbi:hypothetical protein FB45DRAFT_185289 [Roridomyces roridus]|uniref:Uncharacterized protein n=1 Tax=Roridomyces roridus TaxID=1738132 RepID=A0AAD7CEL2_9AGAR|nr:hypothetical protein FB45DRAFT_185289 [Roridomyces roridus]